jgi:hypothetical protein
MTEESVRNIKERAVLHENSIVAELTGINRTPFVKTGPFYISGPDAVCEEGLIICREQVDCTTEVATERASVKAKDNICDSARESISGPGIVAMVCIEVDADCSKACSVQLEISHIIRTVSLGSLKNERPFSRPGGLQRNRNRDCNNPYVGIKTSSLEKKDTTGSGGFQGIRQSVDLVFGYRNLCRSCGTEQEHNQQQNGRELNFSHGFSPVW